MSQLADIACHKCSFTSFCSEGNRPAQLLNFQNAAVKKHLHLEKKELLALPQTHFQNFYAVKKGALKTYRINQEGKEAISGFFFEGEVFGYEGIYANRYVHTITALADTIVCEIPYDNLLKLIDKNPSLQKKILYLVSQQLNIGNYLTSTTAEQRIVNFILDLSERLPSCSSPHQFILPITRQDMGNYLGLTTETVSRILSRFQKNKIIQINNKKITILLLDELKKIIS